MPNLITKQGYAKLLKEQMRLENEICVIRKAAGESLATDGWHENGAFEGANQKYEVLLSMYADIVNQIKSSKITIPRQKKVVGFGSKVTLKIDGKTIVYKILGDADSDIKNGIISINSPLAKALEGKTKGNKLDFKTESISQKIVVTKVE